LGPAKVFAVFHDHFTITAALSTDRCTSYKPVLPLTASYYLPFPKDSAAFFFKTQYHDSCQVVRLADLDPGGGRFTSSYGKVVWPGGTEELPVSNKPIGAGLALNCACCAAEVRRHVLRASKRWSCVVAVFCLCAVCPKGEYLANDRAGDGMCFVCSANSYNLHGGKSENLQSIAVEI
jgi:hypothetical protein